MRLITVIADGAHVRNEPKGIGDTPKNWFDKLAKGDQLEYIRTSEDGEWYYGRIVRIVSGLFLDTRLNRNGWVHKSGVRLDPQPAPPPVDPPSPADWRPWGIFAGVVVVLLAGLLYGCVG